MSPRIPAIEPDLLRSAIFLLGEHLSRLAAEAAALAEDDEEDAPSGAALKVDTRALLEMLSDELGTDTGTTLAVFHRLTALWRLLAANRGIAVRARQSDDVGGGELTDDTVVAAARLDLHLRRSGEETVAAFDAAEFQAALDT